jgi:hypothetical protein
MSSSPDCGAAKVVAVRVVALRAIALHVIVEPQETVAATRELWLDLACR